MRNDENEQNLLDMLIIGGGPGGISALRWSVELGLNCRLLESADQWGSRLLTIYNPIENYLGLKAENGMQIRQMLSEQADDVAEHCQFKTEASSLNKVEDKWLVRTNNGGEFFALNVVLATGVRRRMPNIPNLLSFLGKGLLRSGSDERESVKDQHAVVVGGGDAAAENALILGEFASKVTVIYRGEKLSAREEFTKQIAQTKNINVIYNSEVIDIEGEASIQAVAYRDKTDGSAHRLPAKKLIFRIGVVPNSEIFGGHADLDKKGYIKTKADGSTNVTGLYAIGDVASPDSPTIQGATGQGATVAKTVIAGLKI